MKLPIRILKIYLGGVLFFFSGLIVVPQTAQGGQQPQANPSSATPLSQGKQVDAPADASTESATCQSCHDEITTSFEKSPHWKLRIHSTGRTMLPARLVTRCTMRRQKNTC